MSIQRYDYLGALPEFAVAEGRFVRYEDHAELVEGLRRHNERMQHVLQVLIDHGVTCLVCDDPHIDLDLQDILENV